eukprot:Rmarinus@m.9356
MDSCPVCTLSLATMSSLAREMHINGCLDQQTVLKPPNPPGDDVTACPVCDRALWELTTERRAVHINRCLDEASSNSRPPLRIPSIKNNPGHNVNGHVMCPLCGKSFSRFRSQAGCISHLKKCRAQCGVSPKDLVAILKAEPSNAHPSHSFKDVGEVALKGDIGTWLRQSGLGKYADVFTEHQVDLDLLPYLTDTDLATLGMVTTLERQRFRKKVQHRFQHAPQTSTEQEPRRKRRRVQKSLRRLEEETLEWVDDDDGDFQRTRQPRDARALSRNGSLSTQSKSVDVGVWTGDSGDLFLDPRGALVSCPVCGYQQRFEKTCPEKDSFAEETNSDNFTEDIPLTPRFPQSKLQVSLASRNIGNHASTNVEPDVRSANVSSSCLEETTRHSEEISKDSSLWALAQQNQWDEISFGIDDVRGFTQMDMLVKAIFEGDAEGSKATGDYANDGSASSDGLGSNDSDGGESGSDGDSVSVNSVVGVGVGIGVGGTERRCEGSAVKENGAGYSDNEAGYVGFDNRNNSATSNNRSKSSSNDHGDTCCAAGGRLSADCESIRGTPKACDSHGRGRVYPNMIMLRSNNPRCSGSGETDAGSKEPSQGNASETIINSKTCRGLGPAGRCADSSDDGCGCGGGRDCGSGDRGGRGASDCRGGKSVGHDSGGDTGCSVHKADEHDTERDKRPKRCLSLSKRKRPPIIPSPLGNTEGSVIVDTTDFSTSHNKITHYEVSQSEYGLLIEKVRELYRQFVSLSQRTSASKSPQRTLGSEQPTSSADALYVEQGGYDKFVRDVVDVALKGSLRER